MTNYNLKRFLEAQENSYAAAKKELSKGRKTTHWIWYIFPQIKGLGKSFTAKKYELVNGDEACAYLQNSVLFQRYQELLSIVEHQLKGGNSLYQLFNGHPDDYKFNASLTLFNLAAEQLASSQSQETKYQQLYEQTIRIRGLLGNQGFKPCSHTLNHTNFSKPVKPIKHPEHGPQPEKQRVEKKQSKASFESQVSGVLTKYINLRASEPSYWYQGLFKGYSKQDKLTAALNLYLLLNGKQQAEKDFGHLSAKNGISFESVTKWNSEDNLKILSQGRIGKYLQELVKSNPKCNQVSLPNMLKALQQHKQTVQPKKKFEIKTNL